MTDLINKNTNGGYGHDIDVIGVVDGVDIKFTYKSATGCIDVDPPLKEGQSIYRTKHGIVFDDQTDKVLVINFQHEMPDNNPVVIVGRPMDKGTPPEIEYYV